MTQLELAVVALSSFIGGYLICYLRYRRVMLWVYKVNKEIKKREWLNAKPHYREKGDGEAFKGEDEGDNVA